MKRTICYFVDKKTGRKHWGFFLQHSSEHNFNGMGVFPYVNGGYPLIVPAGTKLVEIIMPSNEQIEITPELSDALYALTLCEQSRLLKELQNSEAYQAANARAEALANK